MTGARTIVIALLCCLVLLVGMGESKNKMRPAKAQPRTIRTLDTREELDRAADARYKLGGVVADYIDSVSQNWLLKMPDRNPAILAMFRDRDVEPNQNLLPWSGEFAGKYLTGAVQVYRLTQNPRLREYIAGFVSKLIACQGQDGYLGPFPTHHRFWGGKSGVIDVPDWDVWGHYHIMLGLLLWYEETGDQEALECSIKMGDMLCREFLNTGKLIVDIGSTEMNHAVMHSLCMLYRVTRGKDYLDLARQIADREFQDPRGEDYIRLSLAGKAMYQMPKIRWEGLHAMQGLAQLYWITGDERYRKAYEQIWWGIVKGDRHNNGGFSSDEGAKGNPYNQGGIETCCTIAWMALSVDMLSLTGKSIIADELELSTLNQVLGYQHRSGAYCTYNTPMDGVRKNSVDDIAFQIRPGSEEINCCSANAPRGFGMISDWALMSDGSGLVLNWYGPSTLSARIKGVPVVLEQQTDYPRDGRIMLHVIPEGDLSFPLRLRIPHWSAESVVKVNGELVPDVKRGTYLIVDRLWKSGDAVQIDLDMSLHYWVGEQECAGKTSIYYGPLLLVQTPHTPLVFSPRWQHSGTPATDQAGEFVEATFEGTAVIWKGKRFDNGGQAKVTIDGREVAIVDQYGPERRRLFSGYYAADDIWKSRGLRAGKHTVRLTLINEKNPASEGRWINVVSLGAPPPEFDAATLNASPVPGSGLEHSQVRMDLTSADGKPVHLQDYGTVDFGVPYLSWHSVLAVTPTPFSIDNPLRSGRNLEQESAK